MFSPVVICEGCFAIFQVGTCMSGLTQASLGKLEQLLSMTNLRPQDGALSNNVWISGNLKIIVILLLSAKKSDIITRRKHFNHLVRDISYDALTR